MNRTVALVTVLALAFAAVAWIALRITQPQPAPTPGSAPAAAAAHDDIVSPPAGTSDEPVPALDEDEVTPRASEPAREQAEQRAFGVAKIERCEGTIRDRAGRPVVGAEVIVFEPALYGPGGRIVAAATTAEDGTYSLRVALDAKLRIAASGEGFQDVREDLLRRPLTGRDFVLRGVE